MKTTQYIRQEKAIAAADVRGIRERWLWGLRLLRDDDAFAPGSSQLKPGRADELVKAAKARGFKLSEREIRYRLQAARAYKTDEEIRQASAEFETWSDLVNSGFPRYDSDPDEALADHRTDEEKRRDHARALVDQIGEQGALFPLTDFEPTETTLKELQEYTEQQEELTERFVKHDQKRRAYLDSLITALDGDLDATWQEAHERLPDEDGLPEGEADEASA